MKLNKIQVKNIRSYKNQSIEFPEGSLLLSGDIGCGKTSILLAIEYALFGLQPGQKGNSLLRNNESSGEVSLELEVSGKKVLIERKLKRSAKGVGNEYAAITINGDKQESSVTEIKSKIVDLLGYPSEFVKKNNLLYRYTVHTAQEQMKQIILEDPETRLNILRHVFGIDKYRQIKNNLATLLSDLKADSKILQGEILTLDKDKENLESRKIGLRTLGQSISSKQTELQEKITERKTLEQESTELEKKLEEKRVFESEIEKTKILITTKKETLALTSAEEDELRKAIVEAGEPFREETYSALLNELKSKKYLFEQLNLKNINLLAQNNLLQQEKENAITKKERIFKIDICPTCLQDVSEHHKHNILNETEAKLAKIKRDIELLEVDKSRLATEISNHRLEISYLEEKKVILEILRSKLEHLEKTKNKLVDLGKRKQTLEKDCSFLSEHMVNMKENILKYAPFEIQFKNKSLELEKAALEEKNTEISLAELQKELEISEKEAAIFEEMIKRKEKSRDKLYNLNELVDWLSTHFLKLIDLTERNVLLKLRKEFSELFRKWFAILVPEGSLESQVDESFTPIIIQGETEMDYSYLSGGERTAVALAYRLALNQTINSLMSQIKTKGLIILDEPTDGFSEAQINKIRDILEELKMEQLIIVSHEQKIESFVDNVLKVTKTADISSVEQNFQAPI